MSPIHRVVGLCLFVSFGFSAAAFAGDFRDNLAQEMAQGHHPVGYKGARRFLMGSFYLIKKDSGYAVRDVYCEREFDASEFSSRKPGPDQIPDDRVVNTEHTWPQSKFTRNYPEELQKSDIHHLFPTDTEMNSSRGSFPFGEVTQDQTQLKCRTGRLGTSDRGGGLIFEPPTRHKGNVARALFYFAVRYQLSIDANQEAFLRKWNKEDPVDAEELERNEQIFKLQGNRNAFINHPEYVDQIQDF